MIRQETYAWQVARTDFVIFGISVELENTLSTGRPEPSSATSAPDRDAGPVQRRSKSWVWLPAVALTVRVEAALYWGGIISRTSSTTGLLGSPSYT